MATYTVRAPDGKTITLQGPPGAAQADIVAQAQRLYKPQTNQYLQIYNNHRNALASKFTDPAQQQIALNRFDSDPRAQRLRQLAGLAPLSTAQGDVKAAAQKSLQQRATDAGTDLGKDASGFQSASAGIARGLFGVPEMLAAAGERFLPSAITGNNTDASYSNILQLIRAKDDAAMAAHPAAGLGGEVGGSIVGGGAAGKAISNVAGRVAASATPAIARVAQAIQNLGRLNKGQKLVNAAKIATVGGAAGGAQAAGQGSDIPTGVAEGALAAPLVAGTAKTLGAGFMRFGQVLSSPFTDFLKMPNAARVLGKITSATTDQMQQEAANIHAANPNANPTLFELLPLADRNRIMSQVASKSDNVAEQAGAKITNRAKQLAPEMQARVSNILQPNRQAIQDGLTDDLATARGGTLAPGDTDLAAKALNSTTDMQAFRGAEADAYMDPHNDKIVGSLNDLLPSTTGPNGEKLEVDPETSNAIRTVAGSARSAPGKPLTVARVVTMIHALKKPNATLDPNVAADAEGHLQSLLQQVDPDVAQSAQQMNDAFAARSRMIEGMSAGGKTQLRDSIDTGTNARSGRLVGNAFDTPEGDVGRTLGQGNVVLSDLGGGPGPALRLTNDIAGTSNDIGRELGQNLGPDAQPIIDAAQASAQSGQALGTALNQIKGGGDNTATPLQTLTQVAAALHPTSFAATKAGAVKKLMGMAGIPENRASTIVDMVFSQDPAFQAKAVNALGNESTGKFVKYLSGISGQLAPALADPGTTPPAPVAQTEIPPAPEPVEQPPAAPAPQADGGSPYAPVLQQTYQNENPDLVNLVQRVKLQESSGDQSKVSKKGAVGVMQVEPKTGPEAAKLAGVPWDPNALKSDAAYNEILGHAYLANLLRKYGGDVGQALAAYNAGQGRVDNALATHGENFLSALPAETQDYVAKVGG